MSYFHEDFLGQKPASKGIVPMTVETRGEDHVGRAEGFQPGKNFFAQDMTIVIIIGPFRKRKIENPSAVGIDPVVFSRTCARIKGILMSADEKTSVQIPQSGFRSIAVVYVEVQDCQTCIQVHLKDVSDKCARMVDQAEPHGAIPKCVVTGRSLGQKVDSAGCFSMLEKSLDCFRACDDGFAGTFRKTGVRVEPNHRSRWDLPEKEACDVFPGVGFLIDPEDAVEPVFRSVPCCVRKLDPAFPGKLVE